MTSPAPEPSPQEQETPRWRPMDTYRAHVPTPPPSEIGEADLVGLKSLLFIEIEKYASAVLLQEPALVTETRAQVARRYEQVEAAIRAQDRAALAEARADFEWLLATIQEMGDPKAWPTFTQHRLNGVVAHLFAGAAQGLQRVERALGAEAEGETDAD